MPDTYDSGEKKKFMQVPSISVAEYEEEVKRIIARDGDTIAAQKKEIEEQRVAIQSKMNRLASLDQEIADVLAKKQAEAALLVSQAQDRLSDTQTANDSAHQLYDQALKDANQARTDAQAAKELRASLETELAVCRSKDRELADLIAKAKEARDKADAIVFECQEREAGIDARINTLDSKSAELDGKAFGLNARKVALDTQESELQRTQAEIKASFDELDAARKALLVTEEEREKFKADVAANNARRDGFIETERRLEARENRLRLDEAALRQAYQELDRRRKNVESLEADAAQKLK